MNYDKQNKQKTVAVVLTCYNRIEKTLRALKTLFSSNLYGSQSYQFTVYLCDDGSTDSTGERVKEKYPTAQICKGTGGLFWAKGMARALSQAERSKPDFYLMINDDVEFFDDALDAMFDSYFAQNDCMAAISGATYDKNGKQYSYGGSRQGDIGEKRWVYPQNPCLKCDLANWNCFLISKELYNKVGPIDDYYEHSYADFDYSNRIYQAGGSMYVADQYIGICNRNPIKGTWMDTSLNIRQRIRLLHKKNGLPIRSQVHYYRKFERTKWIYYVAKPYLAIVKSSVLKHWRKGGIER